MMSTRLLKPCLLMSLSALLFSQPATAHIRTADLNTSRTVLEREWLEMKLELMALRLERHQAAACLCVAAAGTIALALFAFKDSSDGGVACLVFSFVYCAAALDFSFAACGGGAGARQGGPSKLCSVVRRRIFCFII